MSDRGYADGVPLLLSKNFYPKPKTPYKEIDIHIPLDALEEDYDFSLENSTIKEVEAWDRQRKEEKEKQLAKEEAERQEKERLAKEEAERLEAERLAKEETQRLEAEANQQQSTEQDTKPEPIVPSEGEPEDESSEADSSKANECTSEEDPDTSIRKEETTEKKSVTSSPEEEEKIPEKQTVTPSQVVTESPTQSFVIPPTTTSTFSELAPSTVPINIHSVESEALPNLNYSDFESDGTDPFENVELKSINDMEVLARVLQNHKITDSSTVPQTTCSQKVVNGSSAMPSGVTIATPVVTYPYNNPITYNNSNCGSSQNYPAVWNSTGYYASPSSPVTTVSDTAAPVGPSSGFSAAQQPMSNQRPPTVSSSPNTNSFTKFYFPLLTSMANSRRDKLRDWQMYGGGTNCTDPMYPPVYAGQSPIPTPAPVPSNSAVNLGATAPSVPSQSIPYLPNSQSGGNFSNATTIATAAQSPSHNYFAANNHLPTQPNLSGPPHFNSYTARVPSPYSAVPNIKFNNSNNEGTPR